MDSELERFALRQIEMALGPDFSPRSYDEVKLLTSAIEHQCVPFLKLHFANNDLELSPPMLRWNRDSIARTLLYSSILHQVASELDVPWAVLKGIPLAEQLFGSASWRQSTDLDILINWTDLEHVLKVLKKMGFILERKIRPWAYNQIALRHRLHHATLELHWRLTLPYLPAPSTKTLLETTFQFPSKTLGISIPVLGPDATFFNLVMHFHQHFSFIKGAIDLVAWMRLFDLDKGREYCRTYGIGSLCDIALGTTIIRGFEGCSFPNLSILEKRFLEKRVSIQSAFFKESDSELQSYWKQLQNALFLDTEEERSEGFQKGLLFGPHRISDFLQKISGRQN